jgi:hypothetical protein
MLSTSSLQVAGCGLLAVDPVGSPVESEAGTLLALVLFISKWIEQLVVACYDTTKHQQHAIQQDASRAARQQTSSCALTHGGNYVLPHIS